MEDKKIKILGIETSCDDTAVALIEAEGDLNSPKFYLLKNELSSQIKMHAEYGGVVPGLAKRAHSKNLVPVLKKVLEDENLKKDKESPSKEKLRTIETLLEREPELFEDFKKNIAPLEKPDLGLIAVTQGPGLGPALWVGVNFARTLSAWWDIPILGIDHMEGHVAVNLLQIEKGSNIEFPALALAVSGGHTQLIFIKDWFDYELVGETLDDAVGEAFDKIGRLLGLPFPGGPHIEKLAKSGDEKAFKFPRPMLSSGNYNFSFSGLKTAVLYKTKEMSEEEIEENKADIAASFQAAALETLITKTISAAKEYNVDSVLLAGGVAANKELQKGLGQNIKKELSGTRFYLPSIKLATDNAAMIATAGYLRYLHGEKSDWKTMEAESGKVINEEF
ncbi:MAG: tRNA (adenosine(37)-N6)-threonylcarbamoyltransferase complex transferase subunit TsaD [Candidatus Spechtbacterales bacterium]|nr:tRNA (adenosine(37)-N6)-threonylcarbamoyltransferase complex transferase subunit TsaD [Candidatus Spechtbacterales bacterium]